MLVCFSLYKGHVSPGVVINLGLGPFHGSAIKYTFLRVALILDTGKSCSRVDTAARFLLPGTGSSISAFFLLRVFFCLGLTLGCDVVSLDLDISGASPDDVTSLVLESLFCSSSDVSFVFDVLFSSCVGSCVTFSGGGLGWIGGSVIAVGTLLLCHI